jgi:2-dehydro-3-deoxyglucarate aldolase
MNLTLQTIPSTIVSEILAKSFFDGIILDTEHGSFNNESLYSCIQIVTLLKKKCFVRLTDYNKQLIRMCLDAGCDGLVFSTIEDHDQAKEIISYCNYPSYKGKRGCGLVRDNNWGKTTLDVKKPILFGQIETAFAVDNIDFLKELDFDAFLIGPYDLSSSLGVSGQFESEIFKNYMNTIYSKIPDDKMGLFLPTFENMKTLNKSGRSAKILIWGIDINFITYGINNILL